MPATCCHGACQAHAAKTGPKPKTTHAIHWTDEADDWLRKLYKKYAGKRKLIRNAIKNKLAEDGGIDLSALSGKQLDRAIVQRWRVIKPLPQPESTGEIEEELEEGELPPPALERTDSAQDAA